MTRRWAGTLALAALVSSLAAAGCIVLANGTSGYSAADSGSGACTSALDCGDGGQVCCLSASATIASFSAMGTCETSCVVAVPQLCLTSSECGDGGTCLSQSCDAGSGIGVALHACGAACLP